ncbi:copper resistance protein CopZ [Streptomyces solincola]|uniref:Copper resistance protein CopZ n=1 Tax=Streptomyces solincola TaxID=2100817 RepID=A0A2S9PT76_9ACTN|nr:MULTISPECIES: copper chaperone PCu(A)C [Streptomyces]PRH77626.1 copper resistance protein CopZ [Streptomyces solincola]
MTRFTTSAKALGATLALAASLALGGCSAQDGPGDDGGASAEPKLHVSDAYIPQPVGDVAGGFLTVTNTGGAADKLLSVTSPLSDDIQIHKTVDQKMQQVDSLDVPANGALDLERGGNHLMFMEIKKQPKQGEKVAVELRFERSDPIRIELPVEAPTHNPSSPSAHGSAHH